MHPLFKSSFLQLLSALLLFSFKQVSAQMNYRPGYYIGNDSVRVSCLIKDQDWDHNPDRFQLVDSGAPVKVLGLADVREFGSEGDYKYVRAELPVDQSTDKLAQVGMSKDPVWKTE